MGPNRVLSDTRGDWASLSSIDGLLSPSPEEKHPVGIVHPSTEFRLVDWYAWAFGKPPDTTAEFAGKPTAVVFDTSLVAKQRRQRGSREQTGLDAKTWWSRNHGTQHSSARTRQGLSECLG